MPNHSQTELDRAIGIVRSSIRNCEKIQPKFAAGTSQFSLLKNRIKALKIAECLLKADGSIKAYGEEELKNALPPIISIRNKTKKAQGKYPEDSGWYKRLLQTIEAMVIAEEMIERELSELR